MKRLSETWKQQKQRSHVTKAQSAFQSVANGKRRLGRHAVSNPLPATSATVKQKGKDASRESSDVAPTNFPKRISPRLHLGKESGGQSSSREGSCDGGSTPSDISFASDFEIDEDLLKQVEQVEADFQQENERTKSPHGDKDKCAIKNSKFPPKCENAPRLKFQKSTFTAREKCRKKCDNLIYSNEKNRKVKNFIECQRECAIENETYGGPGLVGSFVSGDELTTAGNATGTILCQDSQSPDGEPRTVHKNLELPGGNLNEKSNGLQTSGSPSSGQTSPISPPRLPTSTQECLSLSSWGLSEAVLNQYHLMGVRDMFPWQAQCLRHGKALQGGNLVYSAPTSAGKTLVAELLVLKKVLESKKKAIIILPFVSVSREKMFYLQNLLQDTNIRVDGFMGSHSPPGGLKSVDVAVCTIEKANSLINRLLEEKTLDQLGIIVVDELHMVGDSHRGYILELLLTKIKYVTSGGANRASIQIVGMSATLPNLPLLAEWLDADLFTTNFRPVPLTEFVKMGPALYDSKMSHVKDVDLRYDVQSDEDLIFSLSLETMGTGCGVLIFCPTKNWCEKLAENMARELSRLRGVIPVKSKGFVKASEFLTLKINHKALQDVLEQLKRTTAGLDSTLKKTVPCAVAYHHAGLTFDERDIIEGGFRQGHIRILIATSTLSSGVNLPARRVIIRTIMFNRRVIDPLCYRQMAGRAGRKGVDTEGESILVCKSNEMDKAKALLASELPPVKSCLIQREGDELSNSMKRAILEVIASGVASSPTDVQRYSSSTLLAASLSSEVGPQEGGSTSSAIETCIDFLKEQEFIRLEKGETGETFLPTQLGSATLASALSPHEALAVFTELQRARKSFVLENELHILYQVTPIYDNIQPDWYQFLHFWENLSTDRRRVAELVGVEERFLIRAAKGNIPAHTARQQHLLGIHRRFHTALILEELVNEAPLNQVSRKYGCTKGQLQSLQQSASTFAGMVTIFCSKLGWYNLELILAQFQNRLNFGVQRELVDLVRISLLNAQRARLLYNNGFTSTASLATASPREVEHILRSAVPFKSGRQAVDEKDSEIAAERRAARCIWASGKKGLTEAEAADLIVMEAKHIVKAELGSLGIEWSPEVVEKKPVESNHPPEIMRNEVNEEGKGSEKEGTFTDIERNDGRCRDPENKSRSMNVGKDHSNPTERKGDSSMEAGKRSGRENSEIERDLCVTDPQQISVTERNEKRHTESMETGKIGEAFDLPRKNSGLKMKGASSKRQISTLVEGRGDGVVLGEAKFVSYGERQRNRDGFMRDECMEVKGFTKFCKAATRSVTEDIDLKQTSNEFEKSKTDEKEAKQGSYRGDRETKRMGGNDKKEKQTHETDDMRDRLRGSLKGRKNVEIFSLQDDKERRNGENPEIQQRSSVGDKRSGTIGDKRMNQQFLSATDTAKPTGQSSFRHVGKTVKDRDLLSSEKFNQKLEVPAVPVQLSDSLNSSNSPELFLGSPQERKKVETEGDCPEIERQDGSLCDEKCKTNLESCPKEYSFLFSPIDSHLEDFLENYDSQQELIAVSASPELKTAKRPDDGQGGASSAGDEDRSKSSKELKRGQVFGSKDVRKDLDEQSLTSEDKRMKQTNVDPSNKSPNSVKSESCNTDCLGPQPGDIPNKMLIPAGREQTEGRSDPDEQMKANILEETSECLSPGTLAVLDFLADGNELSYTLVNSPSSSSKSPDLFSEDPDIHLQNAILQETSGRPKNHRDKSKPERKSKPKDSAERQILEKDDGKSKLKSPWQQGRPVKAYGTSSNVAEGSNSAATRQHVRENRRKRKSDEKPCDTFSFGLKRKPSVRSVGKSEVSTRSRTPFDSPGVSSMLPQTPKQRKTPLSFLNSATVRSSSRRSRRRSNPLSKGKVALSFTVETPTDVDIETVSSEGDDLDVAMDSEGLDIELEPSQPDEQSKLATLSGNFARRDKKVAYQGDGPGTLSSELDGNCLFEHKIGSRNNDCSATDQSLVQLSILDSPAAPSTPGTFCIIDVCANEDLFETFLSEWKGKKYYAFSVGCDHYDVPVEGGGIGGQHKRGTSHQNLANVNGLPLDQNSLLITGLAVCWGAKDAYYISFQEDDTEVNLDGSMSAPPNDKAISVSRRIEEVTAVLELSSVRKGSRKSSICKVAFDMKEQIKILSQVLGCVFSGPIEDPKVGHWLMDPSAKEKNLHGMVSQYLPDQAGILQSIGGGIGLSSLGISPDNPGSARLRACVESVLLLDLMASLKKELLENQLLDAFTKVEMPSILTLAHVELNGFGFNLDECETQKIFMQSKLSALEGKAYQLAGRTFSLTSPEDIAQVLFMELKLPPNGDATDGNQGRVTVPPRKTLGGRGRTKLPKQFSTSKDSLEKIKKLHPLPGLILEWRKLSMSLTKVVFPLQKEKVFNRKVGHDRLYTVYQTHTATGRVATIEPNIQAIPKDFEIALPSVIGESPPHWSVPTVGGPAVTSKKPKRKGTTRSSSVQCQMDLNEHEDLKTAVSLRHAFCPFPGGLLLAADYSQLELRILAHLSQDAKLIGILNADGDVFRQIAAQWKNIEEGDVTDRQRQEAKQICYGMIYGIGAKALGEQLDVSEDDASCFMETFRDKYKGMRNFIKQTVDACRERGFVETVTKRKRYLPHIKHSNLGARNHAERQAVNTTIQGSAADLVKTAMVRLQRELAKSFPSTNVTHRHKDKNNTSPARRKTRRAHCVPSGGPGGGGPRGAYLVLQLHDELIYEVHKDDLNEVVPLVRRVMESAMTLDVRLPVKIKVGPTWGSLKEI